MRGINKRRLLFAAIFLIIILALMVSRYLEGAIYAYEICTLRMYTIEYDDGYNIYTTTGYYWDCVTYYGYLYDGTGGGSGGGDDNRDFDDSGSGGGVVIVKPDFDSNDDNIIDCYKNLGVMGGNNELVITSGFRTPTRPDHDGIDIGSWPDRNAIYGMEVFSPCKGTVINIYKSSAGGWTVIIKDDNGYRWGICHLLEEPPKYLENSRVYPGITTIGRADSTGERCDGPHIHLSLKINGQYVDPTSYMSNCY